MKHANSILNKGNKDIGQIHSPEHSVARNMLSFRGSVDWPVASTLGKDALGEMKSETYGNLILNDCLRLEEKKFA